MALLADRVKETTTTSGTGAVTLAGASTGFQAFSTAFAVSSSIYYAIVDSMAGTWEVGIGTLSSATLLTRNTVLASSNSGALVNFAANAKEVFCTMPAAVPVKKTGDDMTGDLSTTGKMSAATLQATGDGTGLLMKDASNGYTYRLYMSAGNLCVIQVT